MGRLAAVSQAAEAEPKIEEDFEGSNYLAKTRGGASLELTTDQVHGGSQSLKVSGRDSSWKGVIWDISSFSGKKIKISCYVKSTDSQVKLTADEGNPWPNITTVDANMDEWTLVEGEYAVNSSISNPGIYLETPNANTDIYVDDFKITVLEAIKERQTRKSFLPENSPSLFLEEKQRQMVSHRT